MKRDLFDKIMFYITVPNCIYCGEKLDVDDRVLCKRCFKKYENHNKTNCPHCSLPYKSCTCSNKFLTTHGVEKLFKVFRYKPGQQTPQNQIIYSLKEDNRKDVFKLCIDELSNAMLQSDDIFQNNGKRVKDVIITSIPRRLSTINKYGYDHAEILAKGIAKQLKLKYMPLLYSFSKKPQKQLTAVQRFSNLKLVLIDKKIDLKNKTIIMVDDVVTTGASMSVASQLFRERGAKKVYGATLSIAYKHDLVTIDEEDRFKKEQ